MSQKVSSTSRAWGDDESPATSSSVHRYIFGQAVDADPDDFPTLAVVSQTPKGAWRCRSTRADLLQCDYPPSTPFEEVMNWTRLHLRRPFVAAHRGEARSLLTKPSHDDRPRTGFLTPDPRLSPREAAERVLQHLERGW